MSEDFERSLNDLFEKAIGENVFSKAVVGFVSPEGSEVRAFNTPENSLFDIASVTKVCPTSTLASWTSSPNCVQIIENTSWSGICSRIAWIIGFR